MPAGPKLALARRWLLRATAAAGWIVGTRVLAGATGSAASSALLPTQVRDLRAWLLRIHGAASRQSFQGTFVVSAGGVVSSARIAHYCVGNDQFERIESLDGQARHVLRHNDLVFTFWPAARSVLVEERGRIASFPALLQGGDTRIDSFYEARPLGKERMAGRDAEVLWLHPRDRLRFGYRLCADQATGLLLSVEMLGEQGEVLESSAFSDVNIGVRPQPDSVLLPMKRLEGYRVVRPALKPARLEAEGWSLRQAIPGFDQLSCVRRPLGDLPVDDRDPAVEVLQAIYSDGLTHVSLFIEPFDAARHRRAMLTAIGATHTLMRRQGDWWLTAVGDVPGATLRQFSGALEYRKP
jgi:sigma-E factor negative regulatory protein RseB